jgi:hypothetical protein
MSQNRCPFWTIRRKIMNFIDDEKFQEYLKNQTCRGCGNRCSLIEPNCGRSRIFIQDAYEKYKNIQES